MIIYLQIFIRRGCILYLTKRFFYIKHNHKDIYIAHIYPFKETSIFNCYDSCYHLEGLLIPEYHTVATVNEIFKTTIIKNPTKRINTLTFMFARTSIKRKHTPEHNESSFGIDSVKKYFRIYEDQHLPEESTKINKQRNIIH